MEISALEKRLANKIKKRFQENTLRTLVVWPEEYWDFSSNDYLGLARNEELARLVEETYRAMPVSNGSGGSRLLSGNSTLAEELELQMAVFFRSEASLLFNSGYVANQGLVSTLPQKGDTLLYDELSHACIKEGARLSLARRFSFRHNDLDHLEQRLKQAEGQAFVVVESVYSMDGDAAPLTEMCRLCENFGAALIVDEAHSTGIYGGGSGLVCELGLQDKVFARVHTFGKGMGSHGACVAGSKLLREYLINFSRPFIYTTALPQHTLVSLKITFDYLQSHPELISALKEKVDYFNLLKGRQLMHLLSEGSQIHSNSPIQAIVYPGIENIKKLGQAVQQKGFLIRPIISPTVPAGKERLRICLHVFNSKEEIEGLINALNQIV